jgi:hypothetical protein
LAVENGRGYTVCHQYFCCGADYHLPLRNGPCGAYGGHICLGAVVSRGALIKNGTALERLAQVDTIVMDKTGTLTMGARASVDFADYPADVAALAAALARVSPILPRWRAMAFWDAIRAKRCALAAQLGLRRRNCI